MVPWPLHQRWSVENSGTSVLLVSSQNWERSGSMEKCLWNFWKSREVILMLGSLTFGTNYALREMIFISKVYINGILVTVQKSFQVEKKLTNVTLMLDEENESQMFGAISDFNIWDRILTREEIEKWSQCQLDINGNILDWNKHYKGTTVS